MTSQPKLRPSTGSRMDFIFVYAAYVLRYVYLLLLIPFYGRVLGVEGYGVVLAAMSLMTICWRFVEWGFSQVGIRELATAGPERYAQLYGQHLSARGLLSLLAVLGGGAAILLSPTLAAHPVAGIASVALGVVCAYNLGWYFVGTGRPRMGVKPEVLGFVISLTLVFSLVQDEGDADLAILALLCSGVVCLAIAHGWVHKEVRGARLSVSKGFELIRSSGAVFLFTGTSALLVSSSTYLLSILSTPAEVGTFGAAERLVAVGLSVMGPAGQIFLPRITALLADDVDAAYRLIRKASLLLLGIGFAGLAGSLLLGHWVIPLIFGPGFENSVRMLHYLALLFPLGAANLLLSSYILIPLRQDGLLAKVVLFGAGISLLLAFPLGSQYAGMGMVVARVVGDSIVFLGLLGCCWKLGILARLFNLRH